MEEAEIEYIHNYELDMLREIDRITRKHNIKYYLAYGSAIGAVRHNGFIPWDTDADVMVDIDSYERLDDLLDRELNAKYRVKHYKNDHTASLLFSRVVLKNDSGSVIHVDIFPMVGLPQKKIKQHLFIRVARLINGLYFFKKVKPKIHYQQQRKKIWISRFLKIIAFPIPSKILIFIKERLEKMYPIKNSQHLFNLCGAYGSKEIILKEWLSEPIYIDFENEKFPIPKEYDKYLTHIYGDYMTPKKTNYV